MKILLDTQIFLWFILFKEIAVLYRQAVRLLRQVNADEERVILTFARALANLFIAGGCDRQ
jgi:PIN domain nuclease of toxin-antitoxin system